MNRTAYFCWTNYKGEELILNLTKILNKTVVFF